MDGTNMLHRSYHALPPMTNSSGQRVEAIHGLMKTALMFFKAWQKDKGTHIAIVFDSKGGSSSRKEIFTEYKSNRSGPEDALISQSKLSIKGIESLGFQVIRKKGIEADDIIATLAERFVSEKEGKVTIYTGDKDMMQLMNDDVSVYNPITKEFQTIEHVKKKFGVEDPKKIVDIQALIGDKIDNIPGCKGVGLVTASELIRQFGSVKKLLKNLDSPLIKSPSKKKLLESEQENIKLSYELAKLNTDLEIETNFKEMKFKNIDTMSAILFCKTWELKDLSRSIETL